MAKILLVDDDDDLRRVIKEWLVFQKHVVDQAENGAAALRLLGDNVYDVIILDWLLGDTTGIEVCKKYRASGGTTPILMLTGQDSYDAKELGLDSGADDYLTKPAHPKELGARVRALIRRPGVSPAEQE